MWQSVSLVYLNEKLVKKMRKKFEKKLEIKKKAVPLQSRSERGARERLRGAGKTEKRKFIEKTGRRQEKVPKKSTSVYSVRATGQVIIEPERQER